MSVFSKIPWKLIGGFVPAFAEIVKQAQEYEGESENPEITDLKKRVATLEAEKNNIHDSFKFVLVSGIIIFLISTAGLVLGIIAVTK
jgi:hypothetical protein